MGKYNGTATSLSYEAVPSGYNFGGKVAVFNGSSSIVTLPTDKTLVDGTWSIETWYKRSAASVWGMFLSGGSVHSTDQLLHLGINDGNTLRFGFYNDDLDGGTYTDTNWHHLVFSYHNWTREKRIYLDGALLKTGTSSAVLNTDGTWRIGKYAPNYYFFNGSLANLRVYSQIITTEEIARHYKTEKSS